MADVANAGIFLYAKDLTRMVAFYEAVLHLKVLRRTDELVVLRSPDLQLLIHATPATIAAGVEISTPPQPRENSAIKFFYTVPSLAIAETNARALGGNMLAGQWNGPGFVVRNAYDPEGNIFQLRERIS